MKVLFGRIGRVFSKCSCPKKCVCENPPPDDWDGKSGVWGISNECPVHNQNPRPNSECPIHMASGSL